MLISILSFYLLVAAKGEAVDGSKNKVQPEKQMWGLNAAGPYYENYNATEIQPGTVLDFSIERFFIIRDRRRISAPVQLNNGAVCDYELNFDQVSDSMVRISSPKTVKKVDPHFSKRSDECGWADFNFTKIAKLYKVDENEIFELCPKIRGYQKITYECFATISEKYGEDNLVDLNELQVFNEIKKACSEERRRSFKKMYIELEGGNKISCQHETGFEKLSLIDFLDSLGKAFKGITVRVPEPNVKNGELQKQKAGKLPVAL